MGAVVTLIPWRSGSSQREIVWDAVRPHYEALGFPVFTGDSDGPWARGGACNAAARAAGRWDVALIGDADTIPEPTAIQRALEIVGDGAIRPHDRLFLLSRIQTRIVLRRGLGELALTSRQRTQLGGGLLVCSRRAWDAVGGFPSEFVGWGHEDSYMATNLLVRASWDRIPGQAWHLWHPRDATNTPERAANRERMKQLQAEHQRVIEEISEQRGWDVGAVL